MIRYGIIGLGNIAGMHAEALKAQDGAKLHSCFSRSADKAEAFAGKHGCRAYSDLAKFLADPELDAVTIATASGARLVPALAAARAGKHILAEKPLEVTPARCEKIIKACQRRVTLGAIFPFRFKDSMRTIREAIHAGRIGKLVNTSAYVKWYRSQEYYDTGGWRGTWKLDGGGCLMNQGIHAVDSLLWVAGDIAAVSAFASTPTRKRVEAETNLVAALKFRNGALGVIEASTEIFPGSARKLEFCGTAGTIACADEHITTWDFEKPLPSDAEIRHRFGPTEATGKSASSPMAFSGESHRRQFQEFTDVLLGRVKKLTCDGREGLRSVRVVCQIYASAKSGRRMRVS